MLEERMPFVSICIATYKREERLLDTLKKIRAQSFSDYEVIVSDNDPEKSSKKIVEEINDDRFRYFNNNVNVGMIKNFNIALSHARGKYIIMNTDDDPPYSYLIETLYNLQKKYPDYGAYFGACDVIFEDKDISDCYGINKDKTECLADRDKDSVKIYSPSEFLASYFSNEVFPYMLWSTGMVEREIAQKIGGMPDYGSPFLTDFGYISLACSYSGIVTINKVLGYQSVHTSNFGRSEFDQLLIALTGFHDYVSEKLYQILKNNDFQDSMNNFLSNWFYNHTDFLYKYFRSRKDNKSIEKLDILVRKIKKLTYMEIFRKRLRDKKLRPYKKIFKKIKRRLKVLYG